MKTNARKRMIHVEDEWSVVQRLLPEGWEAKARELGAVKRLRGVADVPSLLRILLLHLADGCSLKETALRVRQAQWGQLSAVGIFKRLRAAEHWLAWMAAGLRRRGPDLALDRECLAVDATTITEPGPTGSLWRVHWSVNLATLQCEFFEVTDVHGGEKFARFPIQKGQLVMGDRGYSTPSGIDSVRQRGGHVLVRVNPMSLPLYPHKDGQPMNVLARVRGMKVRQIRAWRAWVKGPDDRWHRGRLVAVKRSLAATERELRRRRKISKSQDRQLGPRGRALARYVLIWTSMPAAELSARRVLHYYRLRWQLELVFKRAKSIMGLGQLPKYSDASSRAWLNGKLLVALLVEKLWREAERFSPWGYALARPAKPLA
jgi:hypothetical protein